MLSEHFVFFCFSDFWGKFLAFIDGRRQLFLEVSFRRYRYVALIHAVGTQRCRYIDAGACAGAGAGGSVGVVDSANSSECPTQVATWTYNKIGSVFSVMGTL